MSGVNISNLGIRFGATEVIQGLDLQVREGEFLVLLGPSGCGKSTLLHGVAGLVDVSEGRIEIGGADMTDADPSERGIGMVFQSYALYPTMTVRRNLSFGLRVAGLPRAEIGERVARASRMLHLDPLLDRKPAQLSGGQRQRVAIGRALVREAGVFLFDEPLSNLDAKLRAELRRELKALHQALGATMIYVTHDQVEAMTLASRIVIMNGGRIQQVGTPAEVYARPCNLFVAGFLGSPPMNLLPARVRRGEDGRVHLADPLDVALPDGEAASAAAGGREVVAGIRPEDVRLREGGAGAASVHLVEPMGNHQVAWVRTAGGPVLSALVPDDRVLRPGQPVDLDVDGARVCLFDAATGERL